MGKVLESPPRPEFRYCAGCSSELTGERYAWRFDSGLVTMGKVEVALCRACRNDQAAPWRSK